MLKAGGLSLVSFGAGSLGFGPQFLQRAAAAAPGPGGNQKRQVLVSIFQRGAMDGLMAVPPLEEGRLLAKYRPRLAMGAARGAGSERVLDLGNGFGMHPSLEPLARLFEEGSLAIVHQVGSPDPTRSHFDAQDYMESGTPGRKGTPSGWLNRVSGLLGHEATPFRSVSMTAAMPRSLYGEEAALAVSNLRDFRVNLPGASRATAMAGKGFEALYEQASQDLIRDTARDTFEAVAVLEKLDLDHLRPNPKARYPSSRLGNSLRQIAQLVKADVGLEVAFAETGGWDTHVQQGTTNGTFARNAYDLSQSISAFWTDLGSHRDEVVLTTMTEFGRTVRENGSGGTDHGHGSCLFVLGSKVHGGRVLGDFEGLDHDLLYEGRDLPVTTDFRSVLSGLARDHLGVAEVATVFPGWNGAPIELFRTSPKSAA